VAICWDVLWLQLLVCFASWVAYAFFQFCRAAAIRRWAFGVNRTWRALVAAALLLLPSALLFGVLWGLGKAGALGSNGFVFWGWAVVALAGLGYVHAITLATSLLVSIAYEAVTESRREASELRDSQGSTSDEAPTH